MAKKKSAPDAVEVCYDLSDLPTAQHKAGLAGLVLAIRSLRDRAEKDPGLLPPELLPEITEETGDTRVKIRFTQRSTQALFDDLYDAAVVEVAVKSKWPGVTPKGEVLVDEIDPETKKTRQAKRFLYDVVQPKGTILAPWLPEMPQDKGWLKLWRDMLWQIPRGNPQSRQPFDQRAANQHCKDGSTVWADLLKAQAAATENTFATGPVAGSLWLGAQAINAEGVPFLGRVEHNLLLHFWPLTVRISVPQRIDREGKSEFVGFVIAVPEVSRLKRFCERLPTTLSSLGTDVRGFRPAEAVIDVPAQGALEFVNSIARLTTAAEEQDPSRSVSAVEYLHLDRQGNNIKLLASGRVAPTPELLAEYRDIVGRPKTPPPYRNPLFRAALIQALLRDKPWWGEMLPLFMERDARFFVPAEDVPNEIARLPWFWTDARARLTLDEEKHHERRRISMQTPQSDLPPDGETTSLTTLINRLVRSYVYRRAEERSGERLEKYREDDRINWELVPASFNKEKGKVADSLFLEFRSRRDQAFVDHFAQTFFAVGQYLPDRDQERIARELICLRPADDRSRIDNVKTLTLMALSAAAWTPQRTNKQETDE
jgi:CRISPR-associated protein Cmx8